MTAPTVEDVIAEALAAHNAMGVVGAGWRVECFCGHVIGTTEDAGLTAIHDRHVAAAVVAAIRGMTVEQQAQLIGGFVAVKMAGGAAVIAVGPWRAEP